MSPSINTTPSDDSKLLEPHDTPGRRLRALRESRKLDIERVAAQLHLQRHVVDAIENDQYERLPAPVFVVGYLKNYARLLGADPAPIIAAYRTQAPVRETGLGQALSGPVDSSTSSGSGSRFWVVAVLLIGVLAGAATFWLRGQTESGLDTDTRTLSAPGADRASTVAAPVARPDSAAAVGTTTVRPQSESGASISAPPESIPLRGAETQTAAGAPTAMPPTSGEPIAPGPVETVVSADTLAGASTPPATEDDPDDMSNEEQDAEIAAETEAEAEAETEEQAAPDSTSTEVVLEFTGTSWIDVRGAGGGVVLNGEMRSGDRRVLDGEPPYKFVIGNASATQLTIGGRPFDLQRRARGNVARFTLDPNSID